MESNLSILQQNICNSLWHSEESVHNEASRIFLEYCEKDAPPYYKAEKIARLWIQTRNLLKIAKMTGMYQNAHWDEIKEFFEGRLPIMFDRHLDKAQQTKYG